MASRTGNVRLEAPSIPAWITEQMPFTERYAVEVENHRLHVMERGAGRPVLALHGNPTWGFLYRQVARELRTDAFRFIAPDLVGLGFSTRPTNPAAHTLDNHARWVAKLIDTLELKDYILVVQDWGGPIGVLAANRAANPPAGIVVLNTVLGPPRPDFKPTAFHAFSQMPVVSDVAFRVLGFPQRALWAAQGNRRTISGKVARAYEYPLRKLRANSAPLALARMVPDSLEHPSVIPLGRCRDAITSFEGPIAGVWGERDPVLGSVGRYIEKLLPEARMVFTNAGHFLQEEVPMPIADAIRYVDRRIEFQRIKPLG